MISQHKRPKYSLNFKQDAAKLVLEKGYSHQQAADSLGISLSAIRRWVRAEKGYPTPLGNNQANLNLSEREELIKLECAEFFFYLLPLPQLFLFKNQGLQRSRVIGMAGL